MIGVLQETLLDGANQGVRTLPIRSREVAHRDSAALLVDDGGYVGVCEQPGRNEGLPGVTSGVYTKNSLAFHLSPESEGVASKVFFSSLCVVFVSLQEYSIVPV